MNQDEHSKMIAIDGSANYRVRFTGIPTRVLMKQGYVEQSDSKTLAGWCVNFKI
jgi:hypothetical protein